jgi:hypothetical protein
MNRNMSIALAAAALVAAASPLPAQARCHGCGVAAGVVGGLAAGAIIGSALAGPRYVEPAPVYDEPPPVYVEPPDDVDGPVCHMERQQVWDGFAWRNRHVEVCD